MTAAPIATAAQGNRTSKPTAPAIRVYQRLANKPSIACVAVFLLTLGIRAALLPWMHVPKPAVHDEFSYLLAADTYASGRLANPPHRFWEHFESFHILQQPTYASKYPPMQGLALAFGQKLFGEPWIGVWLSTALMCGAICWMLQGWIALEAALLGGMLVVMQIGIFHYWMNSYWGGSMPAIGGALVLGAIPRIARGRFPHAFTLGIGLAILMNSRPYEGAVLASLSVVVLGWWLRKNKVSGAVAGLRVAVPLLAVLAVAAGAMAYNNYRVTGNPLELPYQLHDRQYAVVSMFAWSKARPEPVYHHAVMRKLWAVWHVDQVKTAQAALVNAFLVKLSQAYGFFFGLWPLLIPPLIWPYALKTTEERVSAFLLVAMLLALLPLTGFAPHYAAAMAGLLYLRFLQTLTRLWNWRARGKPVGFAIATFFVALFVYQFAGHVSDLRTGESVPRLAIARDTVLRTLEAKPGPHLVLVRYSPEHYIHEDWIYNRADIDASPIVWAREMGVEQDRPFIEYFHDRKVWLLEADQSPPRLVPYTSAVPEGSQPNGRSL